MDDSLQSARDAFIDEQLTNAARIPADRGVTDAPAKAYRYAALKAEARARDWDLLGEDPEGDRGYRLYRHD
ncbi:hypothetical protein [Paracoccus jeotgali]|uniref:Uncharacterized protein n=1 Tax=Paracoccus jeotgali TaxID=2065379 RepID=A0A2K9MJG9_9RHOB|nr:hypothetical protein [Paracoccus jeotgali]AUM75781.1 hypothetical protein CYR75_15240 [Paracoccus jeotgali]